MDNDCFYYQDDNCLKGLPGTKCERAGCYAYRQKKNHYMNQEESHKLEAYILQHFPMTNRQFSQALGVSIEVIKYHIKKLGLVGQRKRGAIRLYDEYIRANYPMYSASIIAKKLGITPNTVNIIARRLGVKHNSVS